jgi:hypothetical protein
MEPIFYLGMHSAVRLANAITQQTGLVLPTDYRARLVRELSNFGIDHHTGFAEELKGLDTSIEDSRGTKFNFYPTRLLRNADATSRAMPTNAEVHGDAYERILRRGVGGPFRRSTSPFVNLVLMDRRILELMESVATDNLYTLLGRISTYQADKSVARRPFLAIPGLVEGRDVERVRRWGEGKHS